MNRLRAGRSKFDSQQEQVFFWLPCPNCLWGPLSLLDNGYGGLLLWG